MEITSINQVREKRDSIREKIKSLNLKGNSSNKYGSENEYTFRGIMGGVEALLTDISVLTRHPSKFVKISTFEERNNIVSYLTQIESFIGNPENFIPQFEALKVSLRNYNVRYFSDRHVEFDSEIEEVRKIKLQLQQVLVDSKDLSKNIDESNSTLEEKLDKSNEKLEEIESELETIIECKDKLVEQSETLEAINTGVEAIKESASLKVNEITNLLTESKANDKLITAFATKVQERETRLEVLEQKTEANIKKLDEYNSEREAILKEANELIESAKIALNYKTAEGISASFQRQYENSNDKFIFGSWILGAVLCLFGTVCLGIWILETNPNNIGLLIGRISLLPLPIIGAVFCANQYTKQKNIIEDYAYKMVLSKAIVGFSEQLKKNGTEGNEEYVHYIKTALEEIHRDPLRKREVKKSGEDKDSSLKDLIEMVARIVKISKVE